MEVDTSTAKKNIALELLLEGKAQFIKYEHKKILLDFMEVLRVRSPPVFSQINCGDDFFKVCINLDLTFGDQPKCVVVEGLPCKEVAEAEDNAVTLAFKHFEETEHTEVIDFSTKVARRLFSYNTYGNLIDAIDAVKKMVDNFRNLFAKVTEVVQDLQSKETKDNSDAGKSSNVDVFAQVKNFLESFWQRYDSRVTNASIIIKEIQLATVSEHRRMKEKANLSAQKDYSKTVCSSSKHLLDYVLSSFGLGSVTYTNGPVGNAMVEGLAMFHIPPTRGLKYCGNLTVKGRGENSFKAEEDAAFQSLLLLEDNCNIKILDLKYSRRVEAEEMQIRLVQLINKASDLGESLKEMWGQMSTTLEEYCDHFHYELECLRAAKKPLYDIDHYNYCMDGVSRVQQFCSQMSWHSCFEQADWLEKITRVLGGLKIKLGLP